MMVNVGDVDDMASITGTFDPDSSRSSVATTVINASNVGLSAGNDIDDDEDDDNLLEKSSSDDSDSEEEAKRALGIDKSPRKKKKIMKMSKDDSAPSGKNGGQVFSALAAKFQEDRARRGLPTRKKANNVWGSFLQEEYLTSGMTGIGVGRTLKDLVRSLIISLTHLCVRNFDRPFIFRILTAEPKPMITS